MGRKYTHTSTIHPSDAPIPINLLTHGSQIADYCLERCTDSVAKVAAILQSSSHPTTAPSQSQQSHPQPTTNQRSNTVTGPSIPPPPISNPSSLDHQRPTANGTNSHSYPLPEPPIPTTYPSTSSTHPTVPALHETPTFLQQQQQHQQQQQQPEDYSADPLADLLDPNGNALFDFDFDMSMSWEALWDAPSGVGMGLGMMPPPGPGAGAGGAGGGF